LAFLRIEVEKRNIDIKNLIFKIIDLLLYSFCLDAKRTKKSRKINAIRPKGLNTPADFSCQRSSVPDVDCCIIFKHLLFVNYFLPSINYTSQLAMIKINPTRSSAAIPNQLGLAFGNLAGP
jgi:hypothetical protein